MKRLLAATLWFVVPLAAAMFVPAQTPGDSGSLQCGWLQKIVQQSVGKYAIAQEGKFSASSTKLTRW